MNNSEFTLPPLSPWYKKIFLNYATQVLQSQQKMIANESKNILHYTLKGNNHFQYMNHYPQGDRIDRNTGSQYFYHCHRENYDSQEHGHFHCFMRYKQIPKRIKPKLLGDWDKYIDNPMTHLIAIGMNQWGQPIRLFTVNRWVTSEIVYDAAYMPYFIKRYKMALYDDLYWHVLDQWIEGMLHLFTPQISWLHQEREKRIQEYLLLDPEANPYTNHHLEELSEIAIDLKQQVDWIIAQE